MSYGKRILAEPLRSLVYTSIGSGYTAIGTAFLHPARIICINNQTNVAVIFSYDGANDNELVASGGVLVLNFTENKVRSEGAFMAENTTVYAKQGPAGAPGSGSVYVTVYYGKDA